MRAKVNNNFREISANYYHKAEYDEKSKHSIGLTVSIITCINF